MSILIMASIFQLFVQNFSCKRTLKEKKDKADDILHHTQLKSDLSGKVMKNIVRRGHYKIHMSLTLRYNLGHKQSGKSVITNTTIFKGGYFRVSININLAVYMSKNLI